MSTLPSRIVTLLLTGTLAVACRPTTDARPLEGGATIDAATTSPPRATRSAPVSCASDSECGGGLVCFFVNPGCEPASRVGECHEPTWDHECAVNRPMCSCDRRTLWGKPCAGVIRERWSRLERCSCQADADCKNGQQCFFTGAGCDRAGECDDPAFAKCPEPTATFCTCKGKTVGRTCAQTMREPWSRASSCTR